MALRDFLRERVVVARGSQRFVVTKPKLRTVIALLSLFPAQIYAIRKVLAESGDPVDAADLIPLFLIHDRAAAAEVVATCCELHNGLPGEAQEALAADEDLLIRSVHSAISLSDIDRIAASLQLDKLDAEADAPSDPSMELAGPTDQEISIVIAAERFSCSPLEVMEWPYETWLSVSEILPALEGGKRPASEPEGDLVTDEFSHMGFGVRTVGEA